MLFKKKPLGVTLFELLLVLLVVSGLIVAVVAMYNRVNTSYQEDALFVDVQELAENIHSLFGKQGYANIDIQILDKANIIPQKMARKDGANFLTHFNEPWNVSAQSNGAEFSINIIMPTKENCVSMVGKAFGGVNAIMVDEEYVTTVQQAIEFCNDGSEVAYVFN